MSMNYVTFNQDYSCLAVGTSKGFRIYHTEPFSKIFSSDDGNVALIEMLFSTSLVALILSPRHLVIQNTKRSSIICQLTFPSAVRAVKLNRKRLAVVLEEEIYLYDISNMTLLYIISTSPNPNAIFAFASSSENCYIAYPLPKPREETAERRPAHSPPTSNYVPPTSGDVLIFDTLKLEALNVVGAHRSPLSCIALNNEGTLLATASVTGTIIRVFSLPKGTKLYQFRRGTYPSTIYSITFNLSSTLLCVSSTTDTVHIFRLSSSINSHTSSIESLPRDRQQASQCCQKSSDPTNSSGSNAVGALSTNQKASGTLGSVFKRSSLMVSQRVSGMMGGYLPQTVTEIWEPMRDFAFIKVPKGSAGTNTSTEPLRSVVAISNTNTHVMLATSDGGLYIYNIDMENGGEGVLVKQYSVIEEDDRLGHLTTNSGI